jgi:hypothetical protein
MLSHLWGLGALLGSTLALSLHFLYGFLFLRPGFQDQSVRERENDLPVLLDATSLWPLLNP